MERIWKGEDIHSYITFKDVQHLDNIQRCTAKLFAKTLEFSKTSVSISQVKAKLFIFFQCYSSMLSLG